MKNKTLEKLAKEARSKIEPNSIYFAHPVNIYNTPEEEKFIKIISKKIPEFRVYNPNQPHNQKNYQIWKKETGNGMNYFFDIILPEMCAGVYLPFEDGFIGAGVFGEMESLELKEKPIYELYWDTGLLYVRNFKEMRKNRRLSIDETRKRVYGKE